MLCKATRHDKSSCSSANYDEVEILSCKICDSARNMEECKVEEDCRPQSVAKSHSEQTDADLEWYRKLSILTHLASTLTWIYKNGAMHSEIEQVTLERSARDLIYNANEVP